MTKLRRGFSLIEMVMVIVILGVISAIGIHILMQASNAIMLQSDRKEIVEGARLSMDRMAREIRRIRNRNSVLVANSATFQFVDSSNNTIAFDRSGTSLRRTLGVTVNNLADNASSLAFTYYDANGAQIAVPALNPTDIRSIQIDLGFALADKQLSFRSRVAPRRLQ